MVFLAYTGKDMYFQSSLIALEMNKTTASVLNLVEPLLDKGHTVWLDNFYNSPVMARLLMQKGTDSAGILKINRKGKPKAIKDAKLEEG
jgi:hypothetical protein